MRKIALFSLTFALAGCVTDPTSGRINWTASITEVHTNVRKYAPIVGRNLIMVADILVTAECSPALSLSTQAASNILKIVAPNNSAAIRVGTALQINEQVTQQLCPLVQIIQTSIGAVPRGMPVQVVPATGA